MINLQEKVLTYKDEIVKGIQGAVQIKSVQEPAKEGKPLEMDQLQHYNIS